ncbi:SEC6 [Candida oxycetoniae]|uniref:SEC6 n=1 Tax=Candida oxycetoniae TaxID=497107 RepID=A0AAI9WVV1_9ASCO|nr:SEC6 [Candida oxycetoniae]KAI3402586.2 SEC6 [Candida oxycetoniae]
MKTQSHQRVSTNKRGHVRDSSRHMNNTDGNGVDGGGVSRKALHDNGTTAAAAAAGGNGGGYINSEELGNNRLSYLIAKSIGKTCIITTTDGSRYKGLLIATDLSTKPAPLSVVIKKPQLVNKGLLDEKNNLIDNALPQNLIVQAKDLIDFEIELNINEPVKKYHAKVASSVSPGGSPVVPTTKPAGTASTAGSSSSSPPPLADKSEFKTDSDISSEQKNKPFEERDLVKWEPEESDLQGLTLEEEEERHTSNGGAQWDQFKVNQEKFGVESTYDEHLYTTRINKTASDYKQKVLMAEKLAQEIEKSATTDRHILEERGLLVDDSGMDEEDKYSGVDRRGDELMAALKTNNKSHNNNNNNNNSNSNKIKPSPVPITGHHHHHHHQQQQQQQPNIEDTGKYVTPRQRAAQYHNDPAIISSSAINSKRKAPDSIPAKPVIHNEAFRLNAQSEINSLREFSATFKIPHKMPQDLLPILAKDKLKQSEILKKQSQQAPKQQESKSAQPVATASATRHAPQPQPQPQPAVEASQSAATYGAGAGAATPVSHPQHLPTSPAGAPPSSTTKGPVSTEKKYSKFKLNPNAAVFTPTFKPSTITSPPKANFNAPLPYQSPRATNNRTYSSNGSISSQGSTKRHHQISPQEFFGSVSKVPTKEGQARKIAAFKNGFNLFNTAKVKAEEAGTPTHLVFEKSFQTPPTWDSTIEESYTISFPRSVSMYGGGGGGGGGGAGGGAGVAGVAVGGVGGRVPSQMASSYIPNSMIAATPGTGGVATPQQPILQGASIAAAPIPYNFQIPPQFHHLPHQQQPYFAQQVTAAPMWFIPPPQGFGMINPYLNSGAGGGAHGQHGQQTRRTVNGGGGGNRFTRSGYKVEGVYVFSMSDVALSRIGSLIKTQDDIANVDSIRQQFIKEKLSIDVQLSTMTQLHFDSMMDNLSQMKDTLKKMTDIKGNLGKIQQIYKESVSVPKDNEIIRKMIIVNQFMNQTANLYNDISNFKSIVDSLKHAIMVEQEKMQQSLEYTMPQFLNIHFQYTQIRNFQDYLESYSQSSSDDLKSIVFRITSPTKELIRSFDNLLNECITSLTECTRENNLEILYKIVAMVIYEEQQDLKLQVSRSLKLDTSDINRSYKTFRSRERHYKNFFFEKFRLYFQGTFDACIEYNANDPIALYDNLDWMQDEIVFVHDAMTPLFPPEWNFDTFVQNIFYDKLHQYTLDLINNEPAAEDILKILTYDKKYTDFIKSIGGRSGTTSSIIGDDLKDTVLDDYMRNITTKMMEWNESLIKQESKVFIERSKAPDIYPYEQDIPDVDAANEPVIRHIEVSAFVLPDFKSPMIMMKEQADAASLSGNSKILLAVIENFCACYVERVLNFVNLVDEEMDKYFSFYNNFQFLVKTSKARRLFKKKPTVLDVDSLTPEEQANLSREGLVEYLGALANSLEISNDILNNKFAITYKEKVHTSYHVRVTTAFSTTVDKSSALVSEICISVSNIIINDLYPILCHLFTKKWLEDGQRQTESVMMMTLVAQTIAEYMAEARSYCIYTVYQVLFEIFLDKFVCTYLSIGFENILQGEGKRIDPKTQGYKAFKSRIQSDAELLFAGLSDLFMEKDRHYLLSSLTAIELLADLGTCENPMENIPEQWKEFVLPVFYDCSLDYIKGVVLCRKDMSKSQWKTLEPILIEIKDDYHKKMEPPQVPVLTLDGFEFAEK